LLKSNSLFKLNSSYLTRSTITGPTCHFTLSSSPTYAPPPITPWLSSSSHSCHRHPSAASRQPRRMPVAEHWATRGAGAPAPTRRLSTGDHVQPQVVHYGAQPVGPRRPHTCDPAPSRLRLLCVRPLPRLRPPSAPRHHAPRLRRWHDDPSRTPPGP
jgi:hypothetical protein